VLLWFGPSIQRQSRLKPPEEVIDAIQGHIHWEESCRKLWNYHADSAVDWGFLYLRDVEPA
jgi:hypothetical protein